VPPLPSDAEQSSASGAELLCFAPFLCASNPNPSTSFPSPGTSPTPVLHAESVSISVHSMLKAARLPGTAIGRRLQRVFAAESAEAASIARTQWNVLSFEVIRTLEGVRCSG
jgi:hypothetical protein